MWAGFGRPRETNNDGDPVVRYDKAANRWILTQFSVLDDAVPPVRGRAHDLRCDRARSRPADAPRTRASETLIQAGAGSHQRNLSRWGYYSAMTVDPAIASGGGDRPSDSGRPEPDAPRFTS